MSIPNGYEFERLPTGGIRVTDPVHGEKVAFIPKHMARDLFAWMSAEDVEIERQS